LPSFTLRPRPLSSSEEETAEDAAVEAEPAGAATGEERGAVVTQRRAVAREFPTKGTARAGTVAGLINQINKLAPRDLRICVRERERERL